MLDAAEDAAGIRDAVAQLATIIQDQITDSFGDVNYGRAIAEMALMREEMIELEEPELWDDFVRGLKGKLRGGQLGGDRREMWEEIRRNRLGLVGRNVAEEEAREVSFGRSEGRFSLAKLVLSVSFLEVR